jgi:hypothetical protein
MSADADDLLRRAVSDLAARDGCTWAGIYFVEGDALVLGPEAGMPEPARRTTAQVTWRGTRVAELAVDGAVSKPELETIAEGIADLCLVGWDTGGEVWQS